MSRTDWPLVTSKDEEASGEQLLTSLAGSDDATGSGDLQVECGSVEIRLKLTGREILFILQ